MKKTVVALVAALLLLVAPVSSFAAESQEKPVQSNQAANASPDLIYDYEIGPFLPPSTPIPSTYNFRTVIGNKIYAGVLYQVLGVVITDSDGNHAGYYQGYLYFTGLYID